MRSLLLTVMTALLLVPATAAARPRHHGGHHVAPHVRVMVPGPSLRVVVNPWAIGWAPAPRTGWVWVEGQYDQAGRWVPGYWSPGYARPGYAWVAGHWDGPTYVEGYWREMSRPDAVWMDGYYEGSRWVDGYWAPNAPQHELAHPAEDRHHDYD